MVCPPYLKQSLTRTDVPLGKHNVWNSTGVGLQSYKVGHFRRYDPADVRAFLKAKPALATGEAR